MDAKAAKLVDYPSVARDKLRYGDTDRQGHVNNAVFATFLETGRVEALFGSASGTGVDLADDGAAFVIARLELDFLAEIRWPGEVAIGTRVLRIGTSSVTLEQAVFQNDVCAARAVSVIVQMDEATRKSRPLSQAALAQLRQLVSSSDNA
ncbi:MAG: acyl-CoA thioesterase [Pannonibacter sp.]